MTGLLTRAQMRALTASVPWEDECGVPGELLDRSEGAALLRRSHGTVTKWLAEGLLLPVAKRRPTRPGPAVLVFRRADLERVSATKKPPKEGRARRSLNLTGGSRPLDSEPTDSLPGTEARIRVYESRVERNLAIFHPDDRKRDAT